MNRLITAALGLTGLCCAQDAPPAPTTLTLGVYASEQPKAMFKKFAPVANGLEQALNRSGAESVTVRLRIFKSYDEARTALVGGEIDIARFGPASYVLAKAQEPRLKIAAVEQVKGALTFQGYIVVPKASDAKTVHDLAGKRVAFGDPTSTIGRYLSQQALLNSGLHVSSLAGHEYLGRHDKVFHVVAKGVFDAGALKADTFDKLNRSGKLRILARFDNVTKPWVMRAGIDDVLFSQVQAALIAMDDKAALKTLKVSGFARAPENHFEGTRRGMAAAETFCAPLPSPGKD